MGGMLAYLPFPLALYFVPLLGTPPEPGWLVYAISAGSGVGVATSFLLPWSLLPDTVDDAERQTGQRHEGLFYALFVFFGKLAASLSLGLSSLALELAGFDSSKPAAEQPAAVAETLRVLVGLLPCVLGCLAVAALSQYLSLIHISEPTRPY